jgi:hypothetical protein
MPTEKKSKQPHAMGEGEPSIKVISELERVITYPDGLVIHETRNRPPTAEDTKWLIKMVADLAPYIIANNAKAAEFKAEALETSNATITAA